MDRDDDREHRDELHEREGHASTGGAAAAGAVTGGVIGLAGGPIGAAVGAAGGAVVGAVAELLMHGGKDHQHVEGDENHWTGDHDHTGDDDGHDHTHHYDLGYGMDRTRGAGDSGAAERSATVEVREEELIPHRHEVEAGEVSVHKEVHSERRSVEVPVTHEEVVVERHPVDRRPADRPVGEEESIRVPLHEEEVTLEKRPVVKEEINVGKRTVRDTEEVSGTVRSETARVEREGNVSGRTEHQHRWTEGRCTDCGAVEDRTGRV